MATRLAPILRRSVVATRASSNALRGGRSPPLPPFARIPAPTQSLVEEHDALFDDGVAPELALDFDCQHISSNDARLSWLGAMTGLTIFFYTISSYDPKSLNPAVNRKMNMVVESPARPEMPGEATEETE